VLSILISNNKKDMAPIGFKARARQHQIKFRKEILKAGRGEQEYHLSGADASRGLIFFDGLNVFVAAKGRYDIKEEQYKACYANMLRSEHIPFNFFVPLAYDLNYAREVFNKVLGGIISKIKVIKIEYAPDPADALKDKTSFDVYIEYYHIDGTQGILGIEVKYTEGAYKLIENSKEAKEVMNPNSIYNKLTRDLQLYKEEFLDQLPTDTFRQVWRNQLLGVTMTSRVKKDSPFEHFKSIILFPEGNDHFRNLVPVISNMLNHEVDDMFMGITYEEFIKAARELTTDPEYLRWLQYLEDRYIVKV
jgi:hypothetical protein